MMRKSSKFSPEVIEPKWMINPDGQDPYDYANSREPEQCERRSGVAGKRLGIALLEGDRE
jgi:hypothetical protein